MKKKIALLISIVLSMLMIACDDQEKSFMVDGLRYKIISDSTV